jgi:hypothetical protein
MVFASAVTGLSVDDTIALIIPKVRKNNRIDDNIMPTIVARVYFKNDFIAM